jgi:hypothetical protein
MTVREYIHKEFGDNDLGRQVEAKSSGIPMNANIKKLSEQDRLKLRLVLRISVTGFRLS